MRGGGKVAAGLAVLAAAATPALAAGGDAELLALGRELAQLTARSHALLNAGKEAESDLLVPAFRDIYRRIPEIRATTLAGVAVKLRIAAEELLPFRPGEQYYSTDEIAIVSALADVERMARMA